MNANSDQALAGVVVVTGTDTEVGKTYVTAHLAKHLTNLGIRTIAIKPAESGVLSAEPSKTEDGVLIAAATNQRFPTEALVRLRTPVAPPVAADLEGDELNYNAWCDVIHQARQMCQLVLVEGAGGLLSPLTWQHTLLDLAIDFHATAILVAANRLGMLNHTLLTLEKLKSSHIPVAAGVINTLTQDSDDASIKRNLNSLRRLAEDVPWHECFYNEEEMLQTLAKQFVQEIREAM